MNLCFNSRYNSYYSVQGLPENNVIVRSGPNILMLFRTRYNNNYWHLIQENFRTNGKFHG